VIIRKNFSEWLGVQAFGSVEVSGSARVSLSRVDAYSLGLRDSCL
jgi:hypothetical protein